MLDKKNIYKNACNIVKKSGYLNPGMQSITGGKKLVQVASVPKSVPAPSAYKPMEKQPGTKIKPGDTVESLSKKQTAGSTINKLRGNGQVE